MPKFPVTALALSLAFAGAANATQFVVLDAKGSIATTMPPGSVVDDASLDIPDHDQLTVMNASGESIQVRGPHKGPIAAPSSGDPGVLDRLSAVMKDRQATFGATRGPSFTLAPGAKKDDAWSIDATFSGTFCVFDGRPTQLWKPVGEAATVSVNDDTTGKSASIAWPAATALVQWPDSLPIVDGDRYTISIGTERRTITLKKVAKAGNEGIGSLLAAGAGCTSQAQDLVKLVKPSKTS